MPALTALTSIDRYFDTLAKWQMASCRKDERFIGRKTMIGGV